MIGKEHEAEMVNVASMVGTSWEDDVMVPVTGTAGMGSWEGRASTGVVGAVGEVRWEGASL